MRQILYIFTLVLVCLVILMPPSLQITSRTFYRPRIPGRDLNFKLGLDLQGGTHLAYEADMSGISVSNQDQAILAVRDNISRRIDLLGVSEALIQTSKSGNKHRLLVELPGVKDINVALSTIGSTARLEFAEVKVSSPSAEPQLLPTDLTGKDLRLAQVSFDSNQNTGKPAVSLEFTPEGTKKFAEITEKNIGQPLAILLDGRLITNPPIIREAIPDGRAVISGDFTVEEAKSLSIQLNAGALPVPIHIVEQRNIGATLGSQSIQKSLFAGLVGLCLVWIFMAVNYGKKGFIANISLILYILISLSLFKLIPITLTLAGIAGFILSLGMAVDANILIFERMKEEIAWGRPMRSALEMAFHRAWTSIRDSNISSLITAGILFWFGSGPVRGFAFTLSVGILVSLFTSITITRSLLRLIYARNYEKPT